MGTGQAVPFWVVVMVGVAWGMEPGRALSQYHLRNWQVEDGLPRNYVMTMAPDDEGYLLVGTEEGMARFDGVRFVPFDTEPAVGLARRWTGAMVRARSGSLWVGTFDGWIYELRGRSVKTRYNAGATVFALAEDGAGAIWASSRTGVLRRQAGGAFSAVAGLARPPETAWNVLDVDGAGAVWVVTLDGLFRVEGGAAKKVLSSGGAGGALLAVRVERSGALLVGAARGLYRLKEGAGAVAVKGVQGPVVAILEDRDGVVWVSAWGQGVSRVRGAGVDTWGRSEALPDQFIRTFYEDGEGSLWIGTRGGGLVRAKAAPVTPFGTPEGLGGNYSTTVATGPDGRLWFGTWRGGLYKLGVKGFEAQPTPVAPLYCSVRALAIDGRGRPWIGNWEGLFGYDGRRYRNYAEAGSAYHLVSAILFDRAERLWVATSNNGVFVFEAGAPLRPAASYLAGVEITSLYEDSRGRIWYGTPQGAGWVEAGRATAVEMGWGEAVSAVTEDGRGRVWASTLEGRLWVISERPARALGVREGLPGTALYRLVDDGKGSVWISSPKGVVRVKAAQLDELLSGRRERLEVSLYGREEGMRTPECHHVSQPAGGRDAEGRVWFPTTRGFVSVGPLEGEEARPPAARIEEALVDGRAAEAGEGLRVAAGAHSIEIHYTALRLASAAEIRFRYRMEGFDPEWVEAGTERMARYSGLPPGDYRFVVSAGMVGGGWSEAAALAVYQAPQFHQTGWFVALLAMAALCGALGVYRWRVHILKGRYAAVLGERSRIAREWHDTLLAGFAAITWQLEEALSRLKSAPEQAGSTVELTLKMVEHYRAEARRVIWDLRESRPESETLESAVRAALEQLTRGTGIEGVVESTGEAVKLDEELERNVLRICSEAASNAKKHGRPGRIAVRLEYGPEMLRVRIEDDGAGFAVEKAEGMTAGHFGLAVMRERAERFGGRLKMESAAGRGTIIEAAIPARGQR